MLINFDPNQKLDHEGKDLATKSINLVTTFLAEIEKGESKELLVAMEDCFGLHLKEFPDTVVLEDLTCRSQGHRNFELNPLAEITTNDCGHRVIAYDYGIVALYQNGVGEPFVTRIATSL